MQEPKVMNNSPRLTIRAIHVRGLDLQLARPVETASGVLSTAPLVLIDLMTDEGITGSSYIRCYTPLALQPLVQLVANCGELLTGQAAAPATVEQKLQQHFRLLGTQGLLGMALAGIGLVPDAGGGFFLPHLVGFGKALDLAMLADEVSGPEAERLGLANKCVPPAEFEETVRTFAARLAQGPTSTYGLIKELITTAIASDLETTMRVEGELQDIAVNTADHREGVAAFLQKRPAAFTGH
jgi:Enoyl-CoA hydratase/isomerase/Mandelate racemase / muconate lactonizing enzyme, N-terminal domain